MMNELTKTIDSGRSPFCGPEARTRGAGSRPAAATALRALLAAALVTALAALGAPGAAAQARRPTPSQPTTPAAAAAPVQAASADGVVNLNTASAAELERLPGVGPAKAAAILQLRERLPNRRFARVEDVVRVRGIGRATLRRLRPMLTLDGPTTLVERPRGRRGAASAEAAGLTDTDE
jgi:competence protein ComEA